ncbi:HAD-IIA family hydrolase [Terribacillus sp. 179-K 1B1 HS]|uniref:HAD-IIA family hydrolase n=1 Tax=Terribacillus sp. 179-K 1B1 HS TaxID=3142388 RepID=UPI0039A216B4
MSSSKLNIHDFDAYCFDLDGTIYVGNQLLPGVKNTIDLLRKHDKSILYITNGPTRTREECQQLLCGLGLPTKLEEVITASSLATSYFMDYHPDASVYIVGEAAIAKEFSPYPLRITGDPFQATHVLVGLDRAFTYDKLNTAMTAVRNGAKLIATNPDPACPVPGGFIADTFAIAKAIEVAAGHKIDDIIGKPSAYYIQKVMEHLNVPKDRCLIIGDRLDTDIVMGKNNNISTCLVLTGSSSLLDIEQMNIEPDYVIEDLYGMVEDIAATL